MSTLDADLRYKDNPLYEFHEPSDYSVFYITLAFCSALALFLLVVNVYFCCFSEHKNYWVNTYTGNYWILPFWVRTPADQVPFDLKELEWVIQPERSVYQAQISEEYLELQRKESDI
ncbi:uncharacterized protein wrm1 [Planococcus citri]|uniref:uncharacterized protein wrm1 n=1 Tax=Planococcus citri TaxID=170843 RepID=UPI0031F794EC